MKAKPANPDLFKESHVGLNDLQPLKHKGTQKPLTDLEYMELLAKHVAVLEQEGKMHNFDKRCVAVAKEIARGRREGASTMELTKYLKDCLSFE